MIEILNLLNISQTFIPLIIIMYVFVVLFTTAYFILSRKYDSLKKKLFFGFIFGTLFDIILLLLITNFLKI